jgi:beta-lactamase class A
MPTSRAVSVALTLALVTTVASAAGAEAAGGAAALLGQPGGGPATAADPAPLWNAVNPLLQQRLAEAVATLGLRGAVEQQRLGVALVDITTPGRPRVAALNGDRMMYAASLPKIAVLLAVFERVNEGTMQLDAETELLLKRMIRESSNKAASALMDRVGMEYIAGILSSPRYRLYDVGHNGGLWVGKNYAEAGLWRRDPLHNISHGATPMQVARFYYLLETGRLVSPAYSHRMKTILGRTTLRHKFVEGITSRYPQAAVYRKSGSWRQWHADSAIVAHDGIRYIAVALAESAQGERWLRELIVEFDRLIADGAHRAPAVLAGAGCTAPPVPAVRPATFLATRGSRLFAFRVRPSIRCADAGHPRQ